MSLKRAFLNPAKLADSNQQGATMKDLLKSYCIRAHEASRACDNYTCAAGFKLGHNDPRHQRNNEREKYREIMRFPENIGFIPVAIFTIGVTQRLLVSLMCAFVLRAGTYLVTKAEGGMKK